MKTGLLSIYSKNIIKLTTKQIFFLIFVLISSFLVSILIFNINYYKNKAYPHTFIDNVDISGLTKEQALQKLKTNSTRIKEHQVKIVVDDIKVSSSSTQLKASHDYDQAINSAYKKNNSLFKQVASLLISFNKNSSFSSQTKYDQEKLELLIGLLQKKVEIVGEKPSILLKISGDKNSILITKGTAGRTINIPQTLAKIEKNSEKQNVLILKAVVASTSAVLSDEQVELETKRVENFVSQTLKVKIDDKKYSLNDREIINLLDPYHKYSEEKIEELIDDWSKEVNRKPQNAQFEYDKKSLKVKTFKPNKDGLEINKLLAKQAIISWLQELEIEGNDYDKSSYLEIPLKRTAPKIKLKDLNNLGINERIGFGESYYSGSIPNRVHNVSVTAKRISLTIVAPGKEFSFNKTLGDVSAKTGFRPAYVISGGKTILGDGGGVCQVSSTLFRAVLDAGLKVSKRIQHSYRVSYYELNSDPGFDATVYSGDVDFRFINDTKDYILIYAFVDEENRYMNIEIYGTSDGRTTQISNYKKWDYRNPPAPEYYPTTEIPAGTKKKIDWAVSGIKTEFTHTIKDKDGKIISRRTYYSNYKPWSAKYMVGI